MTLNIPRDVLMQQVEVLRAANASFLLRRDARLRLASASRTLAERLPIAADLLTCFAEVHETDAAALTSEAAQVEAQCELLTTRLESSVIIPDLIQRQ